MNQVNVINEIQSFLEGKNNDLKYVVNVETDAKEKFATCFIHEPIKEDGKIVGYNKREEKIKFDPFLYIKKDGYVLYDGNKEKEEVMKTKFGITFHDLKTANHSRLEKGFPRIVKSSRTQEDLLNFFKEGGLDPYEKMYDENENILYHNGKPMSKNRHLFYIPKLKEQFFISTGIRLFKGFEHYDDIHKVTFDIETTGLRYEHEHIFAIGVRDNRNFEFVIEKDDIDDPVEREKKIIRNFFNIINILKPAVISGYNSEMFDYDFILGRAELLGIDISKLPTTLHKNKKLYRRDATVKFGNTTERYKSTNAYGYTILDILHAVKKTAAVNTEIKNNKLKYICQFEDIAKPNRMYIEGSEIGRFWNENPIFLLNTENNNYVEIPKEYKDIGINLYSLFKEKNNLTSEEYNSKKKSIIGNNKDFIKWFLEKSKKLFNDDTIKTHFKFECGKEILRRYLLDDLWETEQVDNLYNQSSFLLAKLVPTDYTRVATMGNAAVWNLLMTAWSYENDLAIPHSDEIENFSGGLARCYKRGYTKRLVKIDYASLYPMIQLTHDVFPIFDITGVIKKMLTYLTTTRNIYKKLAAEKKLKDTEVELLKTVDNETYHKYVNNSFTKEERNLFKVKQLPIKILNNSLFGALGSGFAFNWSDNICAARITTTGRLYLRKAIDFFKNYGLDPLLAVTDGVNFGIPNTTTIRITDEGINEGLNEGLIEEMWQYNGEVGISALIEYFNDKHMPKPYMLVDNDGEFESCLNLSRINYALKTPKKIKFTGNTIKSKTMPEYIEEFIDKAMKYILDGDGEGFLNYYYNYSEDIFYQRIPLKKIASKSRYKTSIKDYMDRGTDKNGKEKSKQAHMELIIREREMEAKKIFKENFEKFKDEDSNMSVDEYDILDIMKRVETYMSPEPEIGTTIYYVNTGTRKSHGDVKKNPKTGESEIKAKLVSTNDLEKNPDITGEYNVDKYLDAFNKRVEVLLDGFDPEIREKILVKIKRIKVKDASGKKIEKSVLEKNNFLPSELKLTSFEHDKYEDSMFLENKEVEFWNRTGYDPKLIWDGFLTKDDHEHGLLYPNIYKEAIDYVNNMMEKSGKPKVKSVNDKIQTGDLILIKNYMKLDDDRISDDIYVYKIGKHKFRNKYSLGYNNGKCIEILMDDIKVPISTDEKRWIELENQKVTN